MAHPIVHFEIPVDDVQRAKKFYQGLFGWQIQDAGGTVVVPKMTVPTVGYFAQALDTEGNVFAIFEDNPQAQ